MAVGVVSLYINIQNEASSVDLVTGLYNRQYLRRYLGYAGQRLEPERRLVGLMLDVDDFKEINDTHGHVVGDAALRDVGQLPPQHRPRRRLRRPVRRGRVHRAAGR